MSLVKCQACAKTPIDGERYLACARCIARTNSARKTHYCSKACQTIDWPLHKPTICGQPVSVATSSSSNANGSASRSTLDLVDGDDPSRSATASQHVLFHLATLKTLAPSLAAPSTTTSTTPTTVHERDAAAAGRPPADADPFSSRPRPGGTTSASPNLSPIPSYLYFPSDPLAPSSSSTSASFSLPIPIHLPLPSHNLFCALFETAFERSKSIGNVEEGENIADAREADTRKANDDYGLGVTLMYSLLVTSVEAFKGSDDRLVEQLAQEFKLDDLERSQSGQKVRQHGQKSLRELLNEDREPSQEDLTRAIGGSENMPLLFAWQMEEAERLRNE